MNSQLKVSIGTAGVLGLRSVRALVQPTTAYLMLGNNCSKDCSFCAQARSSSSPDNKLSRIPWINVTLDDLIPAMRKAVRNKVIRRACIQVVLEPECMSSVLECLEALSMAGDYPFSVSLNFTNSIDDVRKIFQAGASVVTIPLDACNKEVYAKVKGGDFSESRRFLEKLGKEFPNQIGTHLIFGMGETEEDVIRLAERLLKSNLTVALFAFNPIPGTKMEKTPPPDLNAYRRIQLCIYLMKKGFCSFEDFSFDDGKLAGIPLPLKVIKDVCAGGIPFKTTGCDACNRPYFNERPGGPMYNYPTNLKQFQIDLAINESIEGIELMI